MSKPTLKFSDAFGSWFSGFVDGEDHFAIKNTGIKGRWINCSFTIGLRDDDVQTLIKIKKQLGFGNINYFSKVFDKRIERLQNPQAQFSCHSKKECLLLVQLFNKYPLRSKKANDFIIWKQAVLLMNKKQYGGYDVDHLRRLAIDIKKIRKYKEKLND